VAIPRAAEFWLRGVPMLRPASLFVLLLLASASLRAQEPTSLQEGPISSKPGMVHTPKTQADEQATLDNDAVIRMSKAGLSEQIIAQAIQLQPGAYSTGPDDLIALKQAGVTDKVISLMQAHGTGLSVRPPAPQKPVNVSPLSAGIDEMGVYYQDKSGEWVPLKTERVVIKSGGFIKSTVTHGIVKEDRNGTVNGEHSTLILAGGTTLLIYAPEGTTADEYNFVQFREHSNRREFRVYTGGVFHGGGGSDRDSIEFKAKKVGPRMYSFDVPEDIVVGEYGVLPPGAAAGAPSLNGNGKMFTFRVTEAHAAKKSS
jgi:hypothetical protein